MHFLVLFGPPAVGKMTVGREITQLTGIPVFHNHLSIEPVLRLFEFGTPQFQRLVGNFRRQVFDEVAGSGLPGLIFTYAWDLDDQDDLDFLTDACARFEARGANITLVELCADLDVRLTRNKSEQRLAEKPSKRNLAWSEQNLLKAHERYRMNSGGEIPLDYRHIVIDNTHLEPAHAAAMIVQQVGIPSKPAA